MVLYRIARDNGQLDDSDLCCSDEREYYRIVAETTDAAETQLIPDRVA